MHKKEPDRQNESVPHNISLVWSIDQSFPPHLVFFNRVLRLAHSCAPSLYAPCTLHFLNVSTLSSDFPLNPFFNFDPRDYHRFRFKTDSTFLKQATEFFFGHNNIIFVNNIEHTSHLMHPSQLSMGDPFPHLDTSSVDASKVPELRTRLVHQGEVPNLSKFLKFWAKHEPAEKILSRFNVDMNALKRFKLYTHQKITSISLLLQHPTFLKFLALRSEEINYLTIFPNAVLNMLIGLVHKKILSKTEQDSLALILQYCHQATLSSQDPLEFTKNIHLIMEEIKLLLSDSVYTLDDFKRNFKKLFPDGEAFYANSGSNALSIILQALSIQKRGKLKVINIGIKYYEESISFIYTAHESVNLDTEEKIDVLRIDLKSPANCQRKYKNVDIYSVLNFIEKNNLHSEHFSLVIDGTLHSLSDSNLRKLNLEFKNKFPQGNFVYFGSGVKSHCLGIDVATFGWITVNNSKELFGEFNGYLQKQSQANSTDNPDFQYVTHLLSCCTTQLLQYHEQLLLNTSTIYSALKYTVDMAMYEENNVPYLEIFSTTPLEELLTQLKASLLRYRGSFGFPYPTWLNITNNTERSSIRISCGLLTQEQNDSLIALLANTFEKKLTAKL